MIKEGTWGLVGSSSGIHPIFFRSNDGSGAPAVVQKLEEEEKRKALLKAVSSFRPSETVLEIGTRGNTETAALMKQRRKALSKAVQRASYASSSTAAITKVVNDDNESAEESEDEGAVADMEMADEEIIAVCQHLTSHVALF